MLEQPALVRSARAPAETILSVRGLTKSFGRNTAVDRLEFSVRVGEAVALWGPNGAGKTTAIKCILGLHAYRGEIRVQGTDVRRYSKSARRQVGYVSQELAFYDELSARQVLGLFARLRKAPRGCCDRVLRQVELEEHAHKPVRALSGGMKQRLALAVALLSDPPLLLLDEPTSNLDAASRQALLRLLCELKRAGKTILFSTHRLEEVLQLADRLLVMERGRKVAECRPGELLEQLGPRWALRIPLAAHQRSLALTALAEAGFTAAGNGEAITVRVLPGRKAAPLSVLARAGIVVEDFDLESEDGHE